MASLGPRLERGSPGSGLDSEAVDNPSCLPIFLADSSGSWDGFLLFLGPPVVDKDLDLGPLRGRNDWDNTDVTDRTI